MKTKEIPQQEFKKVRPYRIIYPIIIGFIVIGYLFYKEFDPAVFRDNDIPFTWRTVFWLLVAALCMLGRDIGYMIRIRVLSNRALSWRQAFRIIMLWEFTSSVTPSSVGGTSVALIYIHKEGISVGRSSAIVMLTSLLDELYFIIMFPILWLIAGGYSLFDIPDSPAWSQGLFWVAMIGYSLKLVWVILLCFGLFVNPKGFSRLIYRIFHLPFLKRWKRSAGKAAHDIIITSQEIKSKKFKFWRNAFLSTFLSWSSRYLVVNCIFLAFFAVHDHFLIFARQLVMSIVLLVSPTPGGSGIAEIMFNQFLGEFIPIAGFAVVLALIWRLVTYYPYLIIGTIMFPKWLNDKFGRKNAEE